MFKHLRSKSILYKFFLSYLLIFVMPLIIMTGILYKTSVLDLQKEIEESFLLKLSQLKDNLDAEMKELNYTALKISFDNKLTSTKINGSEYDKAESIDQISQYKANNRFIEDLLVYYKDSGKVFSSIGQYSLSTMFDYIYVLDKNDRDNFEYIINNITAPNLRASEKVRYYRNDSSDMVTYLYPVNYYSKEYSIIVIFFIKKASFDSMLQSILGDLPGGVSIFDQANNPLISTANIKDYDLESVLRNNAPGARNVYIGNENHILVSIKSEVTNLTFVSTIQTSFLYKQATYMKTLILQIVLSLMTFGVFLIIIFSSRNYKPIKKLLGLLNIEWSGNEKKEDKNEMDKISRTIVQAISQNKNLKEQIDLQRPFLEEQIFNKLLKGEITDSESLYRLLSLLKVKMPGPYFCVMVVKKAIERQEDQNCLYNDNIIFAIREGVGDKGVAYPVGLVRTNAIALICNLGENDLSKDKQRAYAEEIVVNIETYIKEDLIVGIGKICNSLIEINSSFIEAMAAINDNTANGNEKYIFFDNIMGQCNQIFWYPVEDQLRFIQSLKQGDRKIALEALNTMVVGIAKFKAPETMLKYVCFDIVNMVIKTINELGVNGVNDHIEKLMGFSNLKELADNLKVISEEICRFVEDKITSKDKELYNKIYEYVNNNFSDCSFNLDNVSSTFKLPIYYLSRLFKEQNGETFTDYTVRLRIEKAKELLSSTDIPLKVIVSNVGYCDLANFMRRFKKLEGITPGQYRKLHND